MSGADGTVLVENDCGVRTITLNRPDSLNALDAGIKQQLLEALKQADREGAVRCLVLTGAGRGFCSGQDLAELKDRYAGGGRPAFGDLLRKNYNPIALKMREMDKPIIAAVNGVAAGAGMSLALACDLRIASEKASFVEAFIHVGLVPDTGNTFLLPRLVGLGKAMELCFTGDKIDAAEALRLGLVNHVVPADDLLDKTMELAQRLASMPTRAIGLTKRLLNQAHASTLAAQLEAEAFAQETAGHTDDHVEGVTAFLEKRKPAYKGR